MEESISNNNAGYLIQEPILYFSASTSKFVIMSICTLGVYDLYWFYKNWVKIKEEYNNDIQPFWRAFFSPIWSYSAFNHINSKSSKHNIYQLLDSGTMAVIYFLLEVSWRLPDPFWLISMFAFLPLIPANRAISKINKTLDSNFKENDQIKSWSLLAAILGGVLLILGTIGTFLP